MNIGIVCYPTFGGSGVVASELGMALAKKGHQVHFITYHHPVRLDLISKNIHFHEVFVEEYPLFHFQPYELALSTKMVETVEKHQLEIVHVHYAIPHAYAAYMAKQMLLKKGIHIKVVTTLHGTDITLVGSHPNYKTAVEFSINQSDAVTTVSESLKNDTLELFDIDNDISVIHNFIEFTHHNYSSLNSCKRDNLALKNEKIIIHISNFRPVKRVKDVISIFNLIQQKIPSKLILVGEGPDKESIEKQAEKLGIIDSILFVGNTSEVDTLLSFSDLFLLPSETESFGLAALEAMAAKTPVISSNTGGLPEVNLHNVTGFLSNVGNVEEMARYGISILKDEHTLNKFKQQAYEQAQKFQLSEIIPLYENLYKKLIA